MKLIIRIILFSLFLILLSACGANKVSIYRTDVFKYLDSTERSKRITNFSFGREKKEWLTLVDYTKTNHGELYYYKKIDDKNYHPNYSIASISAYSDEVKDQFKERATIDNYLSYKINNYNKWRNKKIKYELLDINHKDYGKGYIIKFNIKRKYVYSTSEVIFFYKGYGYTIKYTNLSEYYKDYLKSVEKMINSFKIIEK